MYEAILILVFIAVVSFTLAEIRHIDRERTIKKLILTYLENASPMTSTDLIACLAESGIIAGGVRFYVLLLKLEKENRIESYKKLDPTCNTNVKRYFYRLKQSAVVD